LDFGCWFSARTVQRSTVSFSRPRPSGHMASVCLSLRDDSCGHSTSVLSRISTASLPCLEMKKNVARTYLMLLIEMSSYISHPLAPRRPKKMERHEGMAGQWKSQNIHIYELNSPHFMASGDPSSSS
ncbi:unnamed protein product, partial [Rangifer tarandus platyrhynchus]